jgi:hypothetical protein
MRAGLAQSDMEIVHTRGNISRYLKLASGRASLNILKMAREGLLFDLRSALNRAKKENVAVRKQKVQMKVGNGDGNEGSKSAGIARPVTSTLKQCPCVWAMRTSVTS